MLRVWKPGKGGAGPAFSDVCPWRKFSGKPVRCLRKVLRTPKSPESRLPRVRCRCQTRKFRNRRGGGYPNEVFWQTWHGSGAADCEVEGRQGVITRRLPCHGDDPVGMVVP